MRNVLSELGLRSRLLLLVLLAVIPAFGLIGYSAISQRQQAAFDAERDATKLVRMAATEQSRLIASTKLMLAGLSNLPEVKNPTTPEACHSALAEAHKPFPQYRSIALALANGDVYCRSLPIWRKVNILDRTYFQRAVQSHGFGIGDYQIGRATDKSSINFGYAVSDDRNNVKTVVYAALDLDWFNELITPDDLPADSTVLVLDGTGTVLAHYPDPQKWVGKKVSESTLVKTILTASFEGEGSYQEGTAPTKVGTAEIGGLDGVTRFHAFAPLYRGTTGNVYTIIGLSKKVAFVTANRDFQRNLILLFVAAVLALAAAWIGGDVFVLSRVNALTSAAQKLGKGDLDARTGLPHGQEEFGLLAQTFDSMASGLQRMTTTLRRVNRSLKTLSEGNRVVARAGDEQILLSETCRTIVEVGGYRFAWIGYAEQDSQRTIRPTAQAGFHGGLTALSEFASGLTWSDDELGRSPVGMAIRTGKPYIAQNILTDPNYAPWRDEAARRGYASGVAFPLRVNDKVIGALAIYSQESDAFSSEELELLAEAVQDLAFGISTLRARAEHNRALEHMAFFDGLTGLPNHAHFESRLRREMTVASDHGRTLSLLMIDLTHLREINDALGFHQGDLLLKDVSERLQSVLSEGGFLARMRGDEFAILLPIYDADQAVSVALQVLDVLERPYSINGLKLEVRATVGISLFPNHGKEPAQLMRHADVALHQAKKSDRSYAFYVAGEDNDSAERLALVGDLRRAIEQNELVLYYQPKVELLGGTVCGAEALLRWRHPQRGFIPPDQFIPIAESSGLIKPLTDWVVGAALRQSATWHQRGLNLPIAVNLSTRNLRDVAFLGKIESSLSTWNASADWLELEITEGAMMEDPEGSLNVLQRLSKMGITLFIDDFGTGYSSLGYLKKLPVDAVKIDKSFVIDMLSDQDSAAIVRSTIGLAHDLDLRVVAEGVENQETWDHLAELGCDVIQGYHLSKPLPAEYFEDWCERARHVHVTKKQGKVRPAG